MNAALVTQFLSLINPTFKTCYELTQLSHPNAPFLNVFDFFMQKYKRINEQDCTHNNLIMHAKWTPTDGFEKLVSQINIGMMYTQYANHPIPDQETVDTFIMVIMKCGFFKTSYENLHARPDKNKTWTEATVFLNEEVNLKHTCALTVGQYGFRGNATDTSTTEADAAYEQSVHDFSSTFDKSQTTISGLTATNTQLQQQLQQAQIISQAMNNHISPVTFHMPVQTQQQMHSQHQN